MAAQGERMRADGFRWILMDPPRSEPSFFFRLSKYQQKVIQHIEDRPRCGSAMFGETEYQYVSKGRQNCHLDFGCIELFDCFEANADFIQPTQWLSKYIRRGATEGAQESLHFLFADGILLMGVHIENGFM